MKHFIKKMFITKSKEIKIYGMMAPKLSSPGTVSP